MADINLSNIVGRMESFNFCTAYSMGGHIDGTGWNTRPWIIRENNVSGLSLSGDTQFTLPAGKYFIQFTGKGARSAWGIEQWYDVTNSQYIANAVSCLNKAETGGGSGDDQMVCVGFITNISNSIVFELRHYNDGNGGEFCNFGHTWKNTGLNDLQAGNGIINILKYDTWD